MKLHLSTIKGIFPMVLASVMLASCSVTRFIPEGSFMLDKVSIRSESSSVKTAPLEGYVRQHPNSRWFSLVRVPLLPYMIAGTDSTRLNKLLWRIGEKPVVYDQSMADKCRQDMQSAVRNMGYFDATVRLGKLNSGRSVKLTYEIAPQERYYVRHVDYDIRDSAITAIYDSTRAQSLLHDGMPLDVNVLDQERTRLTKLLLNRGYYKFNKEFITFEADTTMGGHRADITMVVDSFRTAQDTVGHAHPIYYINKVEIDNTQSSSYLRPRVLDRTVQIQPGTLYCEDDVRRTYSAFGGYAAVMSSNIRMQPSEADSTKLDCKVIMLTNKTHGVNAELEGTNTSGDFGAALALSYQNRNLFHGSELFGLKARGAFEAVKGLEGYDDQNYMEYSLESSITFPEFKFPGLKDFFLRRINATSEIRLLFDSQNRPEFHRRVFSTTWRYRWSRPEKRVTHRVDLLDLNYVFMPWISGTFKRDYLDDPNSRNAILRYNYENLFIMKWGYNFSYSSVDKLRNNGYGTDAYTVRFNVETAGNLLNGISALTHQKKNSEGLYEVFSISYAQYAKLDLDVTKSFRFDDNNSLAAHFGLGVAYPYGNGTILPYEKRYFSGGANSVRGWSVRGLGPGSYRGSDGRIDFINQTGDVKLDMSLEYRTHLLWKLDGAAFVDAGNIWTMREYEDQPGGQFHFDTFWRQIAASYGLGVRLNFNYFILRLDAGMKAIHPAYTDAKRHYPIIHPRFKRDCSLHFSVGLPF